MPSTQFTTFNTFSPLQAAPTVNALSTAPGANLPVDTAMAAANNFSTLLRNRAYARLDASSISKSNPDFDSGAAGRIMASLTDSNRGNDPRITRGYIRRTSVFDQDPTSGYRLYFMYNPTDIQRQYVSYLEQDALDPFNTVFNAGNLVAPPGALDFSFDLFFDRQVENANGSMPRGVLEDFDYFDLVVRGVVPDPQMPDLPDNGIMMINPRNITVVFSPQLSVQGRPNTASVQYTKFDHNMRPTRMVISIGMKVFYIGAVVPDFTFAQSKEVGIHQATIPYDESVTYQLVKVGEQQLGLHAPTTTSQFPPTAPGADVAAGVAAGVGAGKATGNTAKYPITQGFSPSGHHGIDFGAPGGTQAIAPGPLYIQWAGSDQNNSAYQGFGTCVSGLTLDNRLLLIYGHFQAVSCNQGQLVTAGQILGLTDNTGLSHGNHLHFEIRAGGIGGPAIDPTPYINSGWQVLA